ncbi:MAG: MATE family efflux transporter [Limimaricola sp.]|uniref:MATE family efflux transporter n=1 Tax=Limimaricola sp. TaxID=2211665 RepID=UPI001D47ECA7|nr:MATE family efflux transporter [Limimaricola sp.]MBI1416239.1 MATE family efflux transporter [Limimaricola sp.]
MSADNPYLNRPLPALFARTALPIILLMAVNGMLSVADALFLGRYAGPSALAAVTLAFPLYMLVVATATIVASGMASLLARQLGAGNHDAAQATFAGAQVLALAAAAVLGMAYLAAGRPLIALAAGANPALAPLAATYLGLTVVFSPLFVLLAVQSDALRSEGRVGFMALAGLLVTLANIGFDYLLIAVAGLGVAGAAWGTAAAQALALALVLIFRARGYAVLRPGLRGAGTGQWRAMLALGAPQGLSFIGMALGASAILAALQLAHAPHYATTVTAYGIVTRVMTFAILPLLGLSQAMQTITGHAHGAGQKARAGASLGLALILALAFCATVEGLAMTQAARIGAIFVTDPAVVAEVAAIMPVMVTLYLLSGPHLMLAGHFQAVGDAPRAALMGLTKPYLFALPLSLALPLAFGPGAVWWTPPLAEALLAVVAILVLVRAHRRGTLFNMPVEGLAR